MVFYDYRAKQIVSQSSAPLAERRKGDGTAEQRVEGWLVGLKVWFQQTPREVQETVSAIGVSGQQHGLIALNELNAPIHPIKLWCDTSTHHEADEIHRACGGVEKVIALAGNPILVR